MNSRKFVQGAGKRGIALGLMVAVSVVIVLIAGVGVYYFTIGDKGSTLTGSSIRTTSNSTTATTSLSAAHTSTSSGLSTTSASTERTTVGASGEGTYSVMYNYSQPLGPGGERVFSNNTVQVYRSVQVASGSFTFSISASNKSGSGSGHGTLVVTTSGFCSGKTTVPYTFLISDATTLLGNLTIFVDSPSPPMFKVPLSCYGPMAGVNTSLNNPAPFLSVYPNAINVPSVPATVNMQLGANFSYYYEITKTS